MSAAAPPLEREATGTGTFVAAGDAAAWHTLPVEAALGQLVSGVDGLPATEAAQRLAVHGPNELESTTRESAWRTLAAQFQNVLILILLAGTIVSGFLGHTLEAVVITVIVLFAV
ncbi:MAG: cation-transporting P-type ATPase, partial [Solimonas sp.]